MPRGGSCSGSTTASTTWSAPTHSPAIEMTGIEFKGPTTTDKLAPPQVAPTKLSHGYAYKGPGQADPAARERWEVATYQFSPSSMTVQQNDSIMLSVFIANGDHHEVELTDADGESIIAKAAWDRGREYTAFFQTRKVGIYCLECAVHRPSMSAAIALLPRPVDSWWQPPRR